MTNKVSLTYQNGNQSNEKTLYPSLVPINGYENFKNHHHNSFINMF